MSARIFVHPRCCAGPALAAFQVALEGYGFDMTKVFIGPEDKRGRRDLVRFMEQLPNYDVVFERMDGVRFTHRAGNPSPEAA